MSQFQFINLVYFVYLQGSITNTNTITSTTPQEELANELERARK